jgi:hypothetical protein
MFGQHCRVSVRRQAPKGCIEESVRPAAGVIRDICEDAERILREAVPALLG